MDIFGIIALAGGAAFFIFGMKILSFALEKTAGAKLKKALGKLTGSRIKGIMTGAGVTAAVQSSSAVTVMLVGLVDSGIMKAENAVGVVMGINIGTTSTAWLMCLPRRSGSAVSGIFGAFVPASAVVGILLLTVSKKASRQGIGTALLGFAVMMNGMEIMRKAASPLAERAELLSAFRDPFVCLVAAALFTAAVQSSSASVGVLQAFAASGMISLSAAIPIIAGQNIGTCVTAAIASLSLNKNAKRVTAWHLVFNLTGAGIFMLLFFAAQAVGAELNRPVNAVEIAVTHTFFNILTTAVLLPFAKNTRAAPEIIRYKL